MISRFVCRNSLCIGPKLSPLQEEGAYENVLSLNALMSENLDFIKRTAALMYIIVFP